jgi:serine/threonine protein kinase/tetratricopeptide (TPR) repeat protein
MREREIFIAALQRDDPKERRAYLEGACGGDAGLWERVQALLGAFDRAGSFLQEPAADLDATGAIVAPHGNGPERIASSPAEVQGAVIGPYKLREQIGEGGMGVVYVAEQTQPVRRKVALKIIKPGMDTKQVIARFEVERQALAMMDHPNIAKVHDAGATESGRPYFVMELVRGIPVTDYCDREKLTIPERLGLFVQVCRAVQHAHQKGIIHRDLKPSNVLVTVIDGAAVPKIIDFGVAKATGGSLTEQTIYTAFHQFVGTPLYMSPEQADLSGVDVDTRSDIYSLGVLLYELLTSTTPFDSETLRTVAFDELRRIIREHEPPRPSTRLSALGATGTTVWANRKADARQLHRSVRGELDWIVMKAIEKDRRRRYETANDFAADVLRYLTDLPVQACPPSAGYRLRKFVRRNKGPVAAGSALAILLVLGTVGTSIGFVWALKAERKATFAAERAQTAEALAKERLAEATKEKDRAAAAEAKAKDEAASAEAVVAFLRNDLLAQASPDENPRAKQVTVEELLGRAATRIAGKFTQQPDVEARIRLSIGKTYQALGKYAAARPHLERAWELYRAHLEDDDLNAMVVLSDLASLYMHQAGAPDPEPLCDKVLKARSQKLGEDHPDTLSAMTSLAEVYRLKGRLPEAEKLLLKMLELSRRARGEKKPDTSTARNNLAVVYIGRGQYDKAEPLLAELVNESPGSLTNMNNLAEVYVRQGKPLKAGELLEKTVELSRTVRGEDHPLTLQEMDNMAQAYWSARKLDRSVPLYEEVVRKSLSALGPDDPQTIRAMTNLGVNYRDAGRLPDAIATLEKAWELDRKKPGPPPDPHSFVPMTLAGAYDLAGRFASSEPLYRAALGATRNHDGKASSQSTHALLNLGVNLLNQQKYTDAEPLLREALETFRNREGEASPHAAGAMAWLGLTLLKQQKYADAEPLLRKVLKFREQKEPDLFTTFNTQSMLGGSLLGQKKFTEAEPLLLAGYNGMKQREAKIPPLAKVRLVESIERLVLFYETTGKNDKAAEWRAKLPVTRSAKSAEAKTD